MGEIADAIINGEFDYYTGEYIGEPVGYPRTHCHKRRRSITPFFPLPKSVETRSITDLCNTFGLSEREKIELMAKFLRGKGIVQLPKLNRQYKIIYHKYREEFKKYVKDYGLQAEIR